MPVELHAVQLLPEGHHNFKHLLGNDRQHLQLNTVELVEASPCTGLRKTSKHAAHGLVVDTIRAVEHNDLACESFAKILHRLSFACSGRSLRSSAQVHGEGTGAGQEGAIRERRDDKTRLVSKVFVSIPQVCSAVVNADVKAVDRVVMFPVVTQLHDPVKVSDLFHTGVNETLSDIAVVNVHDNQGAHKRTLKLREALLYKIDSLDDLLVVLSMVFLKLVRLDGSLNFIRPNDHVNGLHALRREFEEPLLTHAARIGVDGLSHVHHQR